MASRSDTIGIRAADIEFTMPPESKDEMLAIWKGLVVSVNGKVDVVADGKSATLYVNIARATIPGGPLTFVLDGIIDGRYVQGTFDAITNSGELFYDS